MFGEKREQMIRRAARGEGEEGNRYKFPLFGCFIN
jgi:hypothetical protein